MQRYRINYRLLIGLVVGAFVAAPASYGLWRFQVDRNATRLLAKADDADASGDPITRYDSLSQYVKLRPDEMDARRRLGIAAADLADLPDLDVKRRSESYFVLIDAVRVTGDQELRRRLVDLHLRYGFADRALLSINELIEAGQGDAKLKGMRAQCLFATQNATEGIKWSYRLMGYDPKSDEFDQTKAEAPEEPLVYFLAAQYLYANREDELANRVIDQMVEANPESREAFVYQYQILKAQNRPEDARAALTRAYELDPKDAGVLISKGIEAIADYQAELTDAVGDEAEEQRREARRHLDAAAALFAEGIELYPDRSPFYEYAVRVEMVRENYDHALELVDQALKKFDLRKALNVAGLPVAIDLALQKIDILFAQQKLDAVETEIKALRDLGNAKVAPLADYYQARLEMVRQNWLAAAKM
ncbi:MAG TPA: hypothetical protein PKC18_19045, partial [Lacipirellulaceae bacterium]|nr:hypothetical protein [Lacipirellulaceae bacterium]